jgi:hypothetical protein
MRIQERYRDPSPRSAHHSVSRKAEERKYLVGLFGRAEVVEAHEDLLEGRMPAVLSNAAGMVCSSAIHRMPWG